MSYDLYFVRKKDLNPQNVNDILETTEPNPDNEIFISKTLMKSITEELRSDGFKFEIFKGQDEDYFELNFPTYQIAMFNSQIVISMPYWDENSSEDVNKEIKKITNVLLKNDLKGFDPQTEEFITEPYEFENTFSQTKTFTENHSVPKPEQSNGENMIYWGVGLGLVIVGLIIWKLFNK